MTPIDAQSLVARLRDTAVDVVRAYGGLVNQAIGEEIVSVFGVPIAHDDDDLRAVRAALELHASVGALDRADCPSGVRLRVQSGLHIGPSSHDAFRRTATLRHRRCAGDAGGATGCPRRPRDRAGQPRDAAARRSVHAHGAMRSRGARLAGWPSHAVPGARGDGHRDAARGLEPDWPDALRWPPLRAVDARNLMSPAPRAVGERQSRWSARRAQERAGCCMNCRSVSPTPPMCACCTLAAARTATAFRTASSCRFCVPPSASGRHWETRMASSPGFAPSTPRLNRSCRSFCIAVGHERSLRAAAPSSWRTSPGAPARRARDNVRRADARGPLVVLVEDWHWADTGSRAAFLRVAELVGSSRLVLIVTSRLEQGPGDDWPASTRLHLERLDFAASVTIMHAILGVDRVSDALARRLYDRAGGNPFFLEQMCAALLEQQAVSRREAETVSTAVRTPCRCRTPFRASSARDSTIWMRTRSRSSGWRR